MKKIIAITISLSLILSGAISEANSEMGSSLSITSDNKYVSRIAKKQEMLTNMSRNTLLPSSIFNRIELEEKGVDQKVDKMEIKKK